MLSFLIHKIKIFHIEYYVVLRAFLLLVNAHENLIRICSVVSESLRDLGLSSWQGVRLLIQYRNFEVRRSILSNICRYFGVQ